MSIRLGKLLGVNYKNFKMVEDPFSKKVKEAKARKVAQMLCDAFGCESRVPQMSQGSVTPLPDDS